MVRVFNYVGCSMGRFMEGIDVILPGDVLLITDKLNRDRIFYLYSVGSRPFSLNGYDIASKTYYNLEGKEILLGEHSKSYVEIPLIEKWGILYESGLIGRDVYKNLLLPHFILGELFLERYSKDLENIGIVDIAFFYKSEDMVKNLEKQVNMELDALRSTLPRESITDVFKKLYADPRQRENPIIISPSMQKPLLHKLLYQPLDKLLS